MTGKNPKIAAIGEVMVEYSPARLWGGSGEYYQLGFAGDTFNTAVTLARLGLPTTYVTRLGDDPFSDKIMALMRDEGMESALVERLPKRQPGLYVISNSADGERSFHYWRSEAPARELWSDSEATDRLEAALLDYSHLYLSGITLAIMADQPRDRLRKFLISFRDSGGTVVFDSNYRPRLWPTLEQARKVIGNFLELSDIALLTLEDEQALWGISSANELINRWRQHQLTELVIKRGSGPVVLYDSDDIIEVPVPLVDGIVDTTGAGDAFNAGYLAARLQGQSARDAVTLANKTAAVIIRKPGGIVERGYFLKKIAGFQ